jgi:hypothetical protein
MNLRLNIWLFAALLLLGGWWNEDYRIIENHSFEAGEHLEYRVHYGFINAAEAVVHIDNRIQKINNRPCYNVKVTGRTTGAFDLVSKVRDTWQSYIDTLAIVPQQFYTNKREGSYKNVERLVFDHANNQVQRIQLDDNSKTQNYNVPNNVQDVISGYYYLRTLDFDKIKPGQIITIKAFFEGDLYDMRMKYAGREQIKTKFGTCKVLKINPILPKNSFFEDENSIRIWVSDDTNKVPLKVEVELKIGHLAMELKKYSGLKSPLNFK